MANFISKSDLLFEITKSKISYSTFNTEYDEQFHLSVTDLTELTPTLIMKTLDFEYEKQIKQHKQCLKAQNISSYNISKIVNETTYNKMDPTELVIRINTFDHIPINDPSIYVKNKTNISPVKSYGMNFIPFKHYRLKKVSPTVYVEEVGRSHWKNDRFEPRAGQVTNNLIQMLCQFVTQYGKRYNWHGYSYIDEMKDVALCNLSVNCLMFDETKGKNPFAYYTTSMYNSFVETVRKEQKQQDIYQELVFMMGYKRSYNIV